MGGGGGGGVKYVANFEEIIKMLQCCYAFKVLRMLQCFFIKKSLQGLCKRCKRLKDVASLCNLQIVAHLLNVAEFAVPS